MAINTLYTVTLTEQQISYVLGQIEEEYGWNTGKKTPDYLEEMFVETKLSNLVESPL